MRDGTATAGFKTEALHKMQQLESTGKLPPLEPDGMLGQATADAMDPVDVYEPDNCEVEES
jgi:hypothetical protein